VDACGVYCQLKENAMPEQYFNVEVVADLGPALRQFEAAFARIVDALETIDDRTAALARWETDGGAVR
jgi:hypothetical protein